MIANDIIAELEAERDRLTKAIDALRDGTGGRTGRKRGPRGPMSAAARKKISQAAKKRWAAWHKKQAQAS